VAARVVRRVGWLLPRAGDEGVDWVKDFIVVVVVKAG
jgi:hypothetical protein